VGEKEKVNNPKQEVKDPEKHEEIIKKAVTDKAVSDKEVVEKDPWYDKVERFSKILEEAEKARERQNAEESKRKENPARGVKNEKPD
jgi:hypothetical protein